MRLSHAAKAIRKLTLYVVLVTHVHTPDVSSRMRNRWGLMSIWMTRSGQSPDPLDGPVCCSAIPSADSQLLGHTISSKKGDVLDSIDDDDDIEWQDNPLDYRDDQNTETL